MTPAEVYALARVEGLGADSAVIATAVCWAEIAYSEPDPDLDPGAVGDEDIEDEIWGPSVGLWQIRSLRADTGTGRARDIERLRDPAFNARAMATISNGGTDWTPWSVWKNGRYREHLDAVRAAIEGEAPLPVVDIIRSAMADLEAQGYHVSYVDGWERRGRPGSFEPQGLTCHHTATSRHAPGDYPSLGLVTDGRPDLAGPLAQLGLGRSGRVYVIAAGKANHAGPGGWRGLSGNGTVWGIEAENDGVFEPWPPEQIDAYLALAAALARHTGFTVDMICGHKEWTPEKIDPSRIDMDWFRSRVAELLAGSVDPPPTSEEDDMRIINVAGVGIFLVGATIVDHINTPDQVMELATVGIPYQADRELPPATFARFFGRHNIQAASGSGVDYFELVNGVRTKLAEAAQEPLGCAAEDG